MVLTGASDDGARGALAIKRAGGRVIVQSPETAESQVAPSAALKHVTPDAVVDLEQIAGLLCSWSAARGISRNGHTASAHSSAKLRQALKAPTAHRMHAALGVVQKRERKPPPRIRKGPRAAIAAVAKRTGTKPFPV